MLFTGTVRRLFWVSMGATAGVLVFRQLTKAAQELTPAGIADRVSGSGGSLLDSVKAERKIDERELMESARLLGDGMQSFEEHCARGIEPNRERIAELVARSLMLVTALAPRIGYDKAAAIAKKAHKEGTTLREAALALRHVTAAEYDEWVRPEDMIGPTRKKN